MIEKPKPVDDGTALKHPHAAAGQWGKPFPKLIEWMTLSSWADGDTRDGSYLSTHCLDGLWQLTLKDFNLGLEVAVTAEVPEQLNAALEAVLAKPACPWRAIHGFTPKKRGRRR